MAFDTGLLFAIAYNDGTNNNLITTQINKPKVTLSGFGSTDPTWPVQQLTVFDSAGADLGASLGGLDQVFTVNKVSGGLPGTQDAEVVFSRAFFNVATDRDLLLQALIGGGRIELVLLIVGATTQTLTLQLRALKTGTFSLNVNVAERAHHQGASGANLTAPDALTNYTYQIAEDYDNTTNAPLGGYTHTLTASALGDLTLAASATAAPPDAATQTMQVKVSHSTTGKFSILPIDIMVPTELVVLLDRSGSMGATIPSSSLSKWNAAVQVGNLFSDLYGDLVDNLTTGNAPIVDKNKILVGRFEWNGAHVLEWVPSSGNLALASTKPHTPGADVPGGGTPIGQSLDVGVGKFSTTNTAWKKRHLMLLSDGMDNAGSPTLAEIIAGTAGFPSDVIVHVVSYALATETPIAGFSMLAGNHGGQMHDAAPDTDPLASNNLRAMFLNVLGAILPVNRSGPSASVNVPVEEGISRCTFIATKTGTLSLTTPGTTGGTTSTPASSNVDGMSIASVDNPEPGNWSGTVPAGAELYAMYDLALKMRTGAEQHGPGRPIKLWAELRMWGAPVTGADITVGTRSPAESVGELLTAFAQKGGFIKAFRNGQLPATVFTPTALGVDRPRAAVSTVDTRALQAQLLAAAQSARNLTFQYAGGAVTMTEVSPGRYEAIVGSTENENSYNFFFHARGVTPYGSDFSRDQRLTVVLVPVPHPELSATVLTQAAVNGGKVTWKATVFPRTATKKPVGPGLAGVFLNFNYANPDERKKLPALPITDHLDGTYSTTFELKQGDSVPSIGLFGGPVPPGKPATNGVLVKPHSGPARKVRVTLNRIQVLDDKDGLFHGRGELAFSAVVAPNGNPHRAVKTRIPASGTAKLASGQALDVNEVIYEGLVEADARLAVTIGGAEFDYLLFFTRKEKLARYHRVLPLKSRKLGPGDELNDPESLDDWRVWYTLEVE